MLERYDRRADAAFKRPGISAGRLRFFAAVVAVATATLLAPAVSDFAARGSLTGFVPITVIYPIIGLIWLFAHRFSWLALSLLHFILLAATGSAVHYAGGVLSTSSAYYVFLAVATGLLVLVSRAGLWLSLTCGAAFLIEAALELTGAIPMPDSAYSQLYQSGPSYAAMGQVAAGAVVILSASALSRLIARSMHRDSLEKAALYAAADSSRREWEATFTAIADGISVHDESLHVVHANPALGRMLGVTVHELIGRHEADIFPGWYSVDDLAPLERTLKDNVTVTVEVDEPAGRPGLYRVTTYPMDRDDGSAVGAVQIVQDITREKQVQAQLIQTEKMAALGRMVASLAHEINNPLQALHTGLNLLLKPSVVGEKRRQYLDVVAAEVQRLITVTERMLSFYRPSDNVHTPTDLNDLVADVLELAEKTLQRKSVSVETDLSQDLPLLELVSDQFRQVFLSIVLNAIDAMPGGGQLSVSTALVPANGMDAQSEVRVSFADAGGGMEADVLARIFDPFDAAKFGESGLGLAISYGIVEQHGGRIDVKNEANVGSTFTVCLPLIWNSGR
jgi:PAS domain S-box-containing protein